MAVVKGAGQAPTRAGPAPFTRAIPHAAQPSLATVEEAGQAPTRAVPAPSIIPYAAQGSLIAVEEAGRAPTLTGPAPSIIAIPMHLRALSSQLRTLAMHLRWPLPPLPLPMQLRHLSLLFT